MLDDRHGLVEITSRVLQGFYMLRPSEEVNDIILGVLGRAQRLYGVKIHAFVFMSNHFHILLTVTSAEQLADFTRYLKSNLARELGGGLYGWKGTFWSDRYHALSVRFKEHDQIKRFKYILANSCKEGLVASPLDWPGVTSARALYSGDPKLHGTWYNRTAQCHARQRGIATVVGSPEPVELTPLPFLQERSVEEQRAFVVEAVREIERETAEMHKRAGTTPLGTRAILRRNPFDKPKPLKSSCAPPFYAADPEDFWEMYHARKAMVAAYRAAAERLKRGETDVRFPEGCFPPRLPFVKARPPT